jgi:hypothetical protein
MFSRASARQNLKTAGSAKNQIPLNGLSAFYDYLRHLRDNVALAGRTPVVANKSSARFAGIRGRSNRQFL